MEWLFVPYMAVMAAWAGGSLWGHQFIPRYVAEVFFGLPFAIVTYPIIGWFCLLVWVWSTLWFNTGHHAMLSWGRSQESDPTRRNTLTPFINWLAELLEIKFATIWYARLFAAVKGFLITLPVGGAGVFLYPLGYEIGDNFNRNNTIRELLAGAFCGLCVLVFRGFTNGKNLF